MNGLRALRVVAPEADALALAEAIWLAGRVPAEARPPATDAEARSEETHAPPPTEAPTPPPDPAQEVSAHGGKGAGAGSGAPGRLAEGRAARPAREHRGLAWARALHRLGATVERGDRELDVAGTVDATARAGVLLFAWRRRAEPRRSLLVIRDLSPQLGPWEEEVAEVERLARGSGRFVRVHDLAVDLRAPLTDAARKAVRASGSAELVVLVVTDGLARGVAGPTLPALLRALPTAAWGAWAHPWGEARHDVALVRHIARDTPRERLPGQASRAALALVEWTPRGLAELEGWLSDRGARGLEGVVLPDHHVRPAAPGPVDWEARADHVERAHPPEVRMLLALAAGVPGVVDLDLLRAFAASGEAAILPWAVSRVTLARVLASGFFRRRADQTGRLVVELAADGDQDTPARAAAFRWLDRVAAERLLTYLAGRLGEARAAELGIRFQLLRHIAGGEEAPGHLAPLSFAERFALRGVVRLTGRPVSERVRGLLGPDAAPADEGEEWWSPLLPLVEGLPVALLDVIEADLLDGGVVRPRRGERRERALLRAAAGDPARLLNTLGWWRPDGRESIEALAATKGVRVEAEMAVLDVVFLVAEEEGGPWTPHADRLDAAGWASTLVFSRRGARPPLRVVENRLRRARRWVLCAVDRASAPHAATFPTHGSLAWLADGGVPERPAAWLSASPVSGPVETDLPVFTLDELDPLLWWVGVELPAAPGGLGLEVKVVVARSGTPRTGEDDFVPRVMGAFAPGAVRLSLATAVTAGDLVLVVDGTPPLGEDATELLGVTDVLPRTLPLVHRGPTPTPSVSGLLALAGERRALRLPDQLPRLGALLAERAREPRPGTVLHVAPEVVDPTEIPFVRIPASTFWMGSSEGEGGDVERPRHQVRITHDLLVSRTPVTQAQWRRVLDAAREAGLDIGDLAERRPHFEGARRPRESVSWHDARRWCDLLSRLEGRPAVYSTPTLALGAGGYRLPTEAEWEYLCRAGTTSRWSFGEDEARLGEHGWFLGNSGGETHPVGEKAANPWGLYDVHGNVWEWCEDGWDGRAPYPREHASIVADDPLGTRRGGRVVRGGSYGGEADWCRSAYRGRVLPDDRDLYLGFRVVRPVVPRADGE